MRARVQNEDFDAASEVTALRQRSVGAGAIVSFIGLVRDFNEDEKIVSIRLEHYPGMAERILNTILVEAKRRWGICDAIIVHRVGTLDIADQIVLVAISAPHRQEAFLACEFIVDHLKTKAPFWKKEETMVGERWVQSRDSDINAVAGWSCEK